MTLPPAKDEPASPHRHQSYEDALALLLGTLVVALGLTFYANAGLATGGTAGIALLVHYWTGFSIGGVFFTVNLPFYLLAIGRMGWPFTLRTFAAGTLLSVFTRLSAGRRAVHVNHLNAMVKEVTGKSTSTIPKDEFVRLCKRDLQNYRRFAAEAGV